MEYDRRLLERRKGDDCGTVAKRKRKREKERERSRERNGDRDKEKKTMKETKRSGGDDDDDEDGGRRPRVYNSPPGSPPFGLVPRSLPTKLHFLLPPGPLLPPFPLAMGIFSRARLREAARSRQAAEREQTDHSWAEPTPTVRGRYTLLRFALLIRSVREDTVSDRATVVRPARARTNERQSDSRLR